MEKWNLSYLVKSEEEFRERLADANTYIEKLASYQGKLSSQKNFAEFQKKYSKPTISERTKSIIIRVLGKIKRMVFKKAK